MSVSHMRISRSNMRSSTNPDMSMTEIHQRRPYQPAEQPARLPTAGPTPEWRSPDVAAPAVKVEGSVVQRAHATMVHANNEFREASCATVNWSQLHARGRTRQRIDEFTRTAAAKAVDADWISVRHDGTPRPPGVEQVKRELSPPAGRPATELRNTRYWDRTVKMLASSMPTLGCPTWQ